MLTMKSVADQFADWRAIADAAEQRGDVTTLLAMHMDLGHIDTVLDLVSSETTLAIVRNAVDTLNDDVLSLTSHIEFAIERLGKPDWRTPSVTTVQSTPPVASAAHAIARNALAKAKDALDAAEAEMIADIIRISREDMTRCKGRANTPEPRQ